MPTLEDHQRAYHNAMQAGDREAAAVIMQNIVGAEREKALKGAAEEGGAFERGLANLGAGFDTFAQGAKQILPGFKSPSEADIKAKRTRDSALAQATETGAGNEWVPSVGTALQFAGETAPTLAIPGIGTAGNVVAKGALKALPRATEATQALVRAAGVGAVGGGAGAAFQPVLEDESRALNVVGGTVGGAVLPAAGAAARGARQLYRHLSSGGGRARAPEVLREALGGGADDVVLAAENRERARAFQPREVRAIPESLSEASGSANAARVESAARRAPETADAWDDFVREQNASRFNAIERATSEAGRLDARASSRDRVTWPLREGALGEAAKDPWFHVPAADAAERVAGGATSANPAVATVANYVRDQIGANAKAAITPERLYEVRKVLAAKLNGPHVIGDDLSAAAKGAQRETLGLIHSIDEALDSASNGKWSQYLERYQERSAPVNASRAARDARAVFEQPGIPEIGGAPEVTLNRLRMAQKAGQSNFNPRITDFSPRAERTLQAVEDQYVRAQEPARVRKLVGSQGGGSQTSTDIDAALRQLKHGGGGLVATVIDKMTQGSDLAMRTELSRLLQNPREAANAIRAAGAAGKPLTQAQQILLEASARAAALGTAGALTAQ